LTESETTYQQAAELVTSWAFSEGTPARMKELAVSRMAEMPAHVVHADFLACDQFDIMHRLSEIEVPALVFCGTQDYLTPVKYSQYLVEHLPNAQIELIEGAGHMVMLENPQAMLTPLRNFLDRL
jgi:pimeloyl-ACP methyl ester carboxylesterase